jgi:hypothetical protein
LSNFNDFTPFIQKNIGASDTKLAPIFLVRLKGLEPTRIAAREPKSRMSTNSITGAYRSGRKILPLFKASNYFSHPDF